MVLNSREFFIWYEFIIWIDGFLQHTHLAIAYMHFRIIWQYIATFDYLFTLELRIDLRKRQTWVYSGHSQNEAEVQNAKKEIAPFEKDGSLYHCLCSI